MARNTSQKKRAQSTKSAAADGSEEHPPRKLSSRKRNIGPVEDGKKLPDIDESEEIEDPGDLEKETLDRHAPYNKTYGIQNE